MTYGGDQYELWYAIFYWISNTGWICDILKRATRLNLDVAWVWHVQWAWMTSRHGENDRSWGVVRVQRVGINYKLSKTCLRNLNVDSFVTFYGNAQSRKAFQDHWLVDCSTSLPSGLKPSPQRCKWSILLYSLHYLIRAIVQPKRSHIPHQRKLLPHSVTFHLSQNNPYVDILIYSYP